MYRRHQWWFRKRSNPFRSMSHKDVPYSANLIFDVKSQLGVKSNFVKNERFSLYTRYGAFFSTQSTDHNNGIAEAELESNDDYVLQHVPSSSSQENNKISNESLASSSSSPMEKILEAWADAATSSLVSNGNFESLDLNNLSSKVIDGESSSKEMAVKQTLSWFNHMVNQQQENKQSIPGVRNLNITTSTYNIVLHMLAEKTDTASTFILDGTDVDLQNAPNETEEEIATRILQKMKSSNDSQSKPNIETYNAYIACIRRSTPRDAAEEAESILEELYTNSLADPDEPVPNVETYNAVLTWYAMDHSSIDMIKMEELYQEMTQERKTMPNRRTFQIMLHSCSKRIGDENSFHFDPEIKPHEELSKEQVDFLKPRHSQLWIHRMSHLLGKESVDKDIWNLTIPFYFSKFFPSSIMIQTKKDNPRCSSTFLWKNQWENRERKLFPNYDKTMTSLWNLYRYQYLDPVSDPEAEKRIQMALNLERWVEYIIQVNSNVDSTIDPESISEDDKSHETLQLDPTMEALDAIVLAWVETRTKEGLLRAESWALKALEFPHLKKEGIHVNSFLPILTAWAMCGEQFGVQRVEEWITKIEELSDIHDEEKLEEDNNHVMKPNSHIYAAAIQSWTMYQTALIHERSPDHKDDVLRAANQCTEWLEKLCSLDPNPELHVQALDGSVFAHVVDSWMRVLKSQYIGITPTRKNIEKIMNSSQYQESTDKIFHVVELMNSKIVKNETNQVQVFDLLSTFHDVYGIALRPFKNAKFLGRDDLQVNSRFIQIQQMLYVSDILYPHLTGNSDSVLTHKTSSNQLLHVASTLSAFSHPRFVNLCRNLLSSKLSVDVTEDNHVSKIERTHSYDFFYTYLLRISRTLPPSLSKGLKLKIHYGILDRIASSKSPMLEEDTDKSKLFSSFIKDSQSLTSTFEERCLLLDRIVEYGMKEASDPLGFFDSVEKAIKQPYIVEPHLSSVENWIDEKRLYCQENARGSSHQWHLNL